MGLYVTSATLIAKYSSANVISWANVNDEPISTTPTAAQLIAINAAIADAENDVHEHLVDLYDLPFSPVPASIAQVATWLAAAHLYGGMRGARDQGQAREILDALNAADKFFADVRNGRRRIIDATYNPVTQLGTSAPTF